MNKIAVNIAVCGRFHYYHYTKYLHESNVLNRFYYSAPLALDATSIDLPPEKAVNVFLKEYLMVLHARVLGSRWRVGVHSILHDTWQLGVLRQWRTAPVLHYMLHGNGRMLIKRARAEGSVIIGEPVNSHPDDLRNLLNEEYQRLGLDLRETENIIDRRLSTEAEQCDYILAPSRFVKESYVRHGISEERIHVLPYGTDTQRFSALSAEELAQNRSGLSTDVFRVICVGQIIPRKGHVYLLEAWRKLDLPKAELLLIGALDPIMLPVLNKYEGLFRHIQHVPNSELRYFYGVSDVFVLASIEDGFAYVGTEAMGCGIPVITTPNVGVSELIEDGVTGYVVPIRSADAIAEKIEQMYTNKHHLEKMKHAANQKTQDELNWRTYAEKLLSFYKQVMANEQ